MVVMLVQSTEFTDSEEDIIHVMDGEDEGGDEDEDEDGGNEMIDEGEASFSSDG